MAASPDDILFAIKNIVVALNAQVQGDLNRAGAQSFFNVTTPTLIKAGPGRIVNAVLIVAGSTDGKVYDAASTTDTTRQIFTINHSSTTSPMVINLPYTFGLLIVPGTGQTLAGSFS